MSTGESQIRRRIDSWAQALRAKDLERVLAHYSPDALAFDLDPPLQHRRDALRHSLAQWFPTFAGPIGYEIRDLAITAGDDVAFAHSLNHITGRRTDGTSTDVWVRATACFRRIGAEWMIAHEHASVPFYMDGSFRAAVDLQP